MRLDLKCNPHEFEPKICVLLNVPACAPEQEQGNMITEIYILTYRDHSPVTFQYANRLRNHLGNFSFPFQIKKLTKLIRVRIFNWYPSRGCQLLF